MLIVLRQWVVCTQQMSASESESELLRMIRPKTITVELQWLEHLWNHENTFETG